jgi:hypothetical protein
MSTATEFLPGTFISVSADAVAIAMAPLKLEEIE